MMLSLKPQSAQPPPPPAPAPKLPGLYIIIIIIVIIVVIVVIIIVAHKIKSGVEWLAVRCHNDITRDGPRPCGYH